MRRSTRLYSTVLPMLAIGGILALVSGGMTAVRATERPAFCATCHEMKPFYDAWSVGAHKNVSCVDCHVDPGAVAQTMHKVVALKEVGIHLTGDPRFPKAGVSVPDSRCIACHPNVSERGIRPGFSHSQHAKSGHCVDCHSDVGHDVTPAALARAGVLAADATTVGASANASASADTSQAPHVTVSCSRCHDLVKVACITCHVRPHKDRGACLTCHTTTGAWAFSHPASTTCQTCHKPPAPHFPGACTSCHTTGVRFADTKYAHSAATPTCTTCHAPPANHTSGGGRWGTVPCGHCHAAGTPFAATVFSHGSGARDCATCHTPPANHYGSSCSTCHKKPGVSWAFTHTTSTDCAGCHAAPATHFGSACSSCHTPSVAFKATKYAHSPTSCGSCHTPPANHSGSACSTCHKQPGVSWAFTHTTSSACGSCHTPPANHFGTNCAACHTPTLAFASTKFTHPQTNAPHGIGGKACASCHPSSYAVASCTCHGGGSGPGGD